MYLCANVKPIRNKKSLLQYVQHRYTNFISSRTLVCTKIVSPNHQSFLSGIFNKELTFKRYSIHIHSFLQKDQ